MTKGWFALVGLWVLGAAPWMLCAEAATPPAEGSSVTARLSNPHADLHSTLHRGNIDRLQLAWKVEVDDFVSHAPLVDRGALYFADWGGTVYKLDAATAKLLWKKKITAPNREWVWHGLAGTGVLGDGRLYEASVEGNAYALDAESGEILWKARFTEDPHAGNIGELLFHDGLVYIGLSSVEETLDDVDKDFEPDFCGQVVALDAASGKIVWRCALAEPPHNGAGIWSGFSLDPKMNALFFATSNNYTGQANHLSDAFIAVNAKTGKILWSRQVMQHDLWTRAEPFGPDYGFGAAPQLFEAEIDGQRRALVGAGQKSGIFWVVDRQTGEMVWNHPVGYGGGGGGIDSEASLGPGTIYIWSNNNFDYDLPPEKYPMTIKALDMATGDIRWAKKAIQPASVPAAGFLAKDVYLVPSLDGKIRAYASADGKPLWTSAADAGAIGTSLVVADGMLYFGTGIPAYYGGARKGNAVVAYRVAR